MLERGVVCDRCNNGPLAPGDGELVNFPPIALLRAERGLPTKQKQPVAAQFSNARIYYVSPPEVCRPPRLGDNEPLLEP